MPNLVQIYAAFRYSEWRGSKKLTQNTASRLPAAEMRRKKQQPFTYQTKESRQVEIFSNFEHTGL